MIRLIKKSAQLRCTEVLVYGELASSKRGPEHPLLRFKDVCNRDVQALDIDVNRREELAANQIQWRQELGSALERNEAKRQQATDERRTQRNSCLATILPALSTGPTAATGTVSLEWACTVTTGAAPPTDIITRSAYPTSLEINASQQQQTESGL